MSIAGLSNSTLQTILQQMNAFTGKDANAGPQSLLNAINGTQNPSQNSTPSSLAGSGDNPAYVLSSSQKQSQSQLLGYTNMGAQINKASSLLIDLTQESGLGVAVDGNGRPLGTSLTVQVDQLASSQNLISGAYPDATKDVFGTGSLDVKTGGKDSQIQIGDGSLTGVAKSINDASAGISAQVVHNNDGSYSLQITGSQTGAANQFTLSGLSGLIYDPATGQGSLSAQAQAADAVYSVNGSQATSPGNNNIQVAPGIVASFTQTGPMTVSQPAGLPQAQQMVQKLLTGFNGVVQADPSLPGTDPSKSVRVSQMLDQIAGQSYSTPSGRKSLADFGITVGSDGTLSLDQTKMTAAYNADPQSFQSVIQQTASALKNGLTGNDGVAMHVKANVHGLMSQLIQMPSLSSVLSGNAGSASGFGSSATASRLLSNF